MDNRKRECGECTLCCKVMAVTELNKPQNQWCKHCDVRGGGCAIYDLRPFACREFECLWLKGLLAEEYFPKRSHFVCGMTTDGERVVVYKDSAANVSEDSGPLHRLITGCLTAGVDVIIVDGDKRKLISMQGSGQRVVSDAVAEYVQKMEAQNVLPAPKS